MRRLLLCCLLTSAQLHAVDLYWDGSASSNWADLENWSSVIAGGTTPAAVPGATDRVLFNSDGFATAINTLGAAQFAQGLVFNGNASAGTTLGTLNDFLLSLGTSGINAQSGSHLINSSLALTSNQTWTNSGTGTLTAAGTVALNANLTLAGTGDIAITGALTATANRVLTLNHLGNVSLGAISTTAQLTFSTAQNANLIVNDVISGGGAVHKSGLGTVTFNGANSFSGNLRILEGTVKVNTSNASAGQLIFGNASGAAGLDGLGTLTLDNNSAVAFRVSALTYVHPTSDGALINAGGGGAFSPTIALFGDRTFIVNETPAANDLTVEVGIANGDGSNRSLTKQSIGTMVMRGVNTYTGVTNVDRGKLVLDYSLNNGDDKLSNSATTNLRGGTLELQGNPLFASNETLASLTINRANSTVALVSNGEMVTLTLNSGLSRAVNAGVVNFTFNDVSKTQVIATGGAVNNSVGILGGWATVGGDRWATKNVGNQVIAFTGGTTQSDKQQWVTGQHLIIDGSLSGALATNEIASLIFDTPVANTLNLDNAGSALTLTGAALLVSADVGANATAITSGQLMTKQTAGGQTSEMILTNLSSGTFTVGANIGSNNTPLTSTQHLTLAGPGLFVLTGSSSNVNGNTAIQGLVRVSGGNALSDYGTLTMAAGAQMTTGALLDLNGGSEGVGNLGGGGGGDDTYVEVGRGEVRLGTGGILTLNQTAASTLSARITGTNALLIKKGSATFTTTTNVEHTMTGELRVLGGQIDLTNANAGFTSLNTLRLRGGQLRIEQNQTTASVNKLNNNASLILEGTTGSGYQITSNQNATRSETVSSLNIAASANTITLDNSAATTTTAITSLAFGGTTSFTRTNASTLLVRGPNLGGLPDATNESTRVTFTTATTINAQLIGTSTTAGNTNLRILPFALGENSAAGVGNTFLTVDSTVGNSLRTLTNGEYASDYATAGADANLSLNATATGLTSKTLNSLRIVNSGGAVNLTGTAGSTLTLTSGGLLISAGATDNDTVISGYDTLQAGTAAAGNDELIVHVTSSHASAAGATLTLQPNIVDNGGATSVTKSGNGTLILGGTNSYTGATTVNQGVLEFGATTGNLGSGTVRVSGGTLRWAGVNTTDITAGNRTVELLGASVYLTPNTGGYILGVGSVFDIGTNNVTLANSIGNGGHGGLTKTGTGTLALNAAPTYTGVTVVNQGALNFASISPNTTEALYLIQTAGITSGTLSSTIQSGLNLQSLIVGGVYNSGPNVTATVTVNGGAVNIGNGGGDDFIFLGYRDGSATQATTGSTTGTADFRNASSVNINVSLLHLGTHLGAVPSPNSLVSVGNLLLSNGTNVVTANSIILGNAPISVVNTGTPSTINLGTGTTTINVDQFVIGGIRSRADVTIGAGGSFTLRGQQGGTTGANLFIGDNDATGTGTANNSSLNLTGATQVDLKLNLLVLGRLGASTNNGYGRGTLTYAVGTVEADTIRMAEANYTSAGTNPQNTQGTITQSGTATLRFRDLSQGAGTATYNWQGGTLSNLSSASLTNQNVTVSLNGTGSATDPALRSLNVDAGRTATFLADAEFAGSGSFTKTGTGDLILQGTNTNTGNLLISAGKVSLHTAGSLNDTAWINVASGASLDISQRTGATYTSDAVISGTGTLGGTGSTFVVGSNVGTNNTTGVLKPGSSSVITGLASAVTVGNQTGTLTVEGNLTLAATGGARADRALLQVSATDRNAQSTLAGYGGNITTWVDNIPTDFGSFLTGAGTGHDLISTTGTLTLNNTGGISLALANSYTGVFGDVFNLLDWSILESAYTSNGFTTGNRLRDGTETGFDLNLPALQAGLIWDTSLFQNHGVIVVVPEPSRLLLLLLALPFLITRRRR